MKKYNIFDMDGTLIDSMRYWDALGRDFLKSKGIEVTEKELEPIATMTMQESSAFFRKQYHLKGTEEEIAEEMYAVMDHHYRNDIPLKAGVREYLRELKASGAHMCVATVTDGEQAGICLHRLGVLEWMDFLISGEEIGIGKTEPDIYLMAAERFGSEPAETAVFEDAPFAAETAKRAGFYTVGVYDRDFDREWDSMKELCDETIRDWREAHR